MEAAVIIPARFESLRLPGKPILDVARKVTGKYIIQHVYERACRAACVSQVIVATDDERIVTAVQGFGGTARLTSRNHNSGTDRIAEVAADLTEPAIVNVQGDEPQIEPEQIEHVVRLLEEDPHADMGTLAHEIESTEVYYDPHAVKVVVDARGYALYFSRSPIPYVRDAEDDPVGVSPIKPLRHLGLYSYRREFLLQYAKMQPAPLEDAERLEQLRALSSGHRIKVGITPHRVMGIDTPQDLERWLALYR